MNLRDFIKKTAVLKEGGNLEIDGQAAQHIDLKVHNRAYIVPVLNSLLNAINSGYQQQYQEPLWNPKLLKTQQFLSGSSLHFFNTTGIPDEEFQRVKPKVGDIDTQVNKAYEGNLEQYLTSVQGKIVGNAKCLGFQRGNEQFSSLWELTDPPIKVQIDLEFVKYDDKGKSPTAWSQFSHSSSWDDIQAGVKGVFHKFLIQAFTSLTDQEFLLRKFVGRGKARVEQDVPTSDNMLSFAVSSKEGGGLRAKYEPVLDDRGQPLVVDGLPVMRALPAEGYEQDIGKIFGSIFGKKINGPQMKKLESKFWSFTGLLEVMNTLLDQADKEKVVDSFINKIFAPGAQGLYKNDPDRDLAEKNAALNLMLSTLKVTGPTNLEQMRSDYKANYRMTSEAISKNVDAPELDEAVGDAAQPAQVKAQLRKGMPHLHDLKPADLLDLLDEIHDGNGNFKLQNIPLNVKVDGFGGRFGKNAEGKPFMGTSRTEPRYEPGFVAYHQQKGTTDPEVLGRAQLFDNLFEEMMNAVKLVDSKLGPDFLVNKQVTCEVLYLPFATETEEGKLKFVGIHYDQLPAGVKLALVPFRIVDATTGEDLPDSQNVIKELTSVGQSGSVMFIDNSLTQNEALDVTALVPPLENIEQMKAMLASRKRDQAAEVKAALQPVAAALEKAIIEDPNIVGKELLGKDYEGIVINSRLGPIKVTSQEQRDVITAKNAAKANARTERPRGESKTAVVAIGSFIGHKGHQDLFQYTIDKAKEVGGDPYLFIGNAESKDDPIPPAVKVETWHKLYPQYAKNISTVQAGGQLIQKVKHELINPLPGKPPRYDNIIIMVGEDRAGMNMPTALMKAVNKFPGYEHVKVSLEVTPRESGFSGTMLRNSLKNDSPEQALATWSKAFDVQKLGVDWIKHLMDITRKGMGIQEPQPAPVAEPVPVAETRLLNALIRPDRINELDVSKTLNFATKAHQGQQYGEKPYITHPRSVAATGKKFFGAAFTPDAIKVALLHDVVEDTPYKLNQLAKMGYSPEVVQAVQLLTKNKALSYADNIRAIIASNNKLAMMVKYADNYQNFTGDKSSWDPARAAHSQKKYLASLDMLGDKLGIKQHLSRPEQQGTVEGLGKDIKRLATGKDVKSRAGQEIAKSQDASMKGDTKTSKKHFDRYDKLDKLANKDVAEGSEYKSRHAHKQEQDKAYNDYRTKHATSSLALMTRAEFAKDQRERAAKKKQGVAEGSGKNVVKSVKVGNFRHDLVNTGMGWQVRIYNGDELYDTGLSKNSEEKGLAALDNSVAYTKKQLNIKEQGVAENIDLSGGLLMILNTLKTWSIPISAFAAVAAAYGVGEAAKYLHKGKYEFEQIAADALETVDKTVLDKIADKLLTLYQRQVGNDKSVAEERMSAAVRMQRAADRQRAKSDASLRRTPSSIPKPEPKKDEKVAEKMMPASNFAGSKKNKLGSAGQWKNTGPSKNRPARAGDLVGGDSIQPKGVPISEDVENIMDALINKIIFNEAVSNNK